jgi:peptidoglycan hydrolase-like protein with peptidoglycan-binding domain
MTVSQNGWTASPDKTSIGIESPKVPGTDVDFPQGIRKGDVTTILLYVAEQFHQHVEPLVDGDCWGYFYKFIEGSTAISNHASGTAIDLNAPKHPMGKANTFNTTQVGKIREILNFLEGAVRWGGDYSTRKDEMHFEINKGEMVVARIAAKVRAISNPPTPPDHDHVLQQGDTGQDVTHLQQFFHDVFPAYRFSVTVSPSKLITVDGNFGPQTKAWVLEFQARVGISRDGVVGSETLKKLRQYGYKY